MSEYVAEKLTPRAIVEELDRYIVGQKEAKRAVAIALRNRWRRQQLPVNLRDEIAPKNILLAGPTGVGKTEIARRLAKLAGAPFLKVEASKFTEVGYVGRDVDSIVRDLMEVSVHLVKEEAESWVAERAREAAENRILAELATRAGDGTARHDTQREQLRAGALDNEEVEIQVSDSPQGMFEVFSAPGVEQIGIDMGRLQQMFSGGRNTKTKRLRVKEALSHLISEETQKLIDMDRIVKEAITRAEESGIVFLDEIDKIAGGSGRGHGPDISREGVQRDLLPIVEGSSVTTKYGVVKTDHVLFIAAGAFHVSKPSDLIPELQGRFPIRVQLEALSGKDLVRILTEPEHSLTRQYEALLSTEGVRLEWKEEAVLEIARLAEMANDRLENIGARRLHTMLERLLEEVSFDASEMRGAHVPITANYVRDRLGKFVENDDLSRYIL